MKPTVRQKQPQQPELPLNLHGVAELMACLALAVKQLQFYGTANAAGQRALDAARIVFQDVWAETDRLHVDVRQNSFEVEGHVVHEGGDLSDSLPFLFYKDGIRELLFFPGFEGAELVRFMDVIRRARSVRSDDDDLVTLLWHEDLACLRYGYVDPTADTDDAPDETPTAAGGGGVGASAGDATAGDKSPGGGGGTSVGEETPAASQGVIRAISAQSAAAEADASPRSGYDDPPALAEFGRSRALVGSSTALLLLDPDEMAVIQADLERELGRDLVRDVVNALLDSLEDAPPAKQGEILAVLAGLVPAHLAEGRFELVAATLCDLRSCTDRGKVAPEQAAALAAVWSGPQMVAAVDALLIGLQSGDVMPRTSDVERLFAVLGPVSFQRLVRSAESVKSKDFRAVLQAVVVGAMTTHRDVVYAALDAADVVVLRGVLQLLQQHPDPVHAQRVQRLLDHDDAAVREGAVQVVVVGGGRDGIPRLRHALGDSSSGVRTAALWGLGAWCAAEVKADLEARLQDRTLTDAPATEKMALFEAYARIGAAAAVPLLARILLGRVGWRGHWPSELRVCAARVLRLTQSPEARGYLEKAARDEDDGVRRAAQRALQRLEAPA